MNEKAPSKRKEWVKNAAIIFLTVMLALTFFSNTIMNYSLPEVATQYVQPGTINAKIRGTGTVEATDPYNVVIDESRTITSVAVKAGDEVEKDAILFYLDDTESEELTTAENELDTLILEYMKGLFSGDVTGETINKVESGSTDSFGAYQAKIESINNKLTTAENNVRNCQAIVDNLSSQQSLNSGLKVDTTSEQSAVDSATANLTNAQNEQTRLKDRVTELQAKVDEAAGLVGIPSGSGGGNGGTTGGTGGTTTGGTGTGTTGGLTGGIEDYQKVVTEAEKEVNDAKTELDAKQAEVNAAYTAWQDSIAAGAEDESLKAEYDKKEMERGEIEEYKYKPAVNRYNVAKQQLDDAIGMLGNYDGYVNELNQAKADLENAKANVNNAQKTLDSAKQALTNKTNSESVSIGDQNSLTIQKSTADKNLAAAKTELETVTAERDKLIKNLTSELDLSSKNEQIAKKEEQIAKLRAKSVGTTVKAPVAGTVTEVNHVAGETTKPDDVMAVMQVKGKGFTVGFSVTADQAKKVNVGDMAEPQNAWYYEDLKAQLASVKPDPNDPAQKKLLTFNVSGDVQAGQSLALQLGQRSADYELVVPNSSVREDNNGKFILTVESKSSPLGNRYIANRVDVEVLASDDTNTAISAGLYGYEYVITTSTKPVEAGKQVRLTE